MSGSFNMRFRLYDAQTGGTERWTETDTAVSVVGGLFSTTLGDGAALETVVGAYPNLWLEVAIDLNGNTTFESTEVYSPRQRLASAAWAITADRLGGQPASYFQRRVTGTAPTGRYIRQINSDGSVVTGIDNGDISAVVAGAGLSGGATSGAATLSLNTGYTDSRYWMLTGNSGLTSGTHFIGTLSNVPLDLRTNNTRALRLEPTGGTPNLLGSYGGNSAAVKVVGATIGGGERSASPTA